MRFNFFLHQVALLTKYQYSLTSISSKGGRSEHWRRPEPKSQPLAQRTRQHSRIRDAHDPAARKQQRRTRTQSQTRQKQPRLLPTTEIDHRQNLRLHFWLS